ncbi:MAG TPA: hypothetical protein VMS78_16860 [Rhizomicrobium sp.]|nr:hypothetical protein [Rhizomicrobium sp.]
MPAPVFQQQFDQRAAIASARGTDTAVKTASTNAASTDNSKDDDGFSFDDFLDIINPLQHIPVVSTIYRHLTGDTIKPFERLAGDTLFGGLWGGVSSAANLIFEHITGKDFGDTAYAMVFGDDDKTTAVASTSPTQQVATAAPRKLSQLASNGLTQGLDSGPEATVAYTAALDARDLPSDLAQRALAAYKRATDVSQSYYGALPANF